MADPGHLPISNVPVPITKSGPTDTPRSRSGHSSHDLLSLDIGENASAGQQSTVMYGIEASREGMPHGNPMNVMCQKNLHQHNLQRNVDFNEIR